MGFRSFVKNTAKNNTNVKSWSAWGSIKENAKIVKNLAGDIGVKDKVESTEKVTFAAAMKQYGLSESDIGSRMKNNLILAIFCGLLSLAALVWAVLLLMKFMFLSSLMGFALSLLMFSYAFRSHFYYFQLKQRRLDCTVKEWFSSFFSNKK